MPITLTGVNGSVDALAAIGFLVGDVNNSRTVDLNDVRAIKARSGQRVDVQNFRYDIKASGKINASDVAATKARSGTQLP